MLFRDCNSQRKDIVKSKQILYKGIDDIKGEMVGLGGSVEAGMVGGGKDWNRDLRVLEEYAEVIAVGKDGSGVRKVRA
jgi:hypothetical protein